MMTPEQKLKWAILLKAADDGDYPAPEVTAENVDDLYEQLEEAEEAQDPRYELREGQVRTGLPCPSSRHYESESVASKMPDGSWVGWTFWYGGGKHGEPESIDWMNSAYALDCVEEEKLVVVQTFSVAATPGVPA